MYGEILQFTDENVQQVVNSEVINHTKQARL